MRGWVVAEGAGAADNVALKPIAKVSPGFVAPELIELSTWAAWRWAGKRRHFLNTATQPVPLSARAGSQSRDELPGWATSPFERARSVVRLAPAIDPFPIVAAAAERGPALVLVPSLARVERLQRRLRQEKVGGVVVGARAGAWAPCDGLAAVVVIDAHDEVYAEERTPTWNAWRVAAERAARNNAPCVLVTPTPTLELLAFGDLISTDSATERRGWARLEVVDRRGDDPRKGLWSTRVVEAARSADRVVCVLNRTGRAKLLACASCSTIASCEKCAAAVSQPDEALVCGRCGTERPLVCLQCGASKFKALRIGTSRAAEELAALVGSPVGEVTGASDDVPDTRVVVGTEAVLHRVGRADLVVFIDFDAELAAPHFRANEATAALLARASRLVRGRLEDGRVIVQTRQPDHPLLRGATDELAAVDDEMRVALDLPPHSALAQVAGEGAGAVAEQLRKQSGVSVVGPDNHDAFLIKAANHGLLCDALQRVERPAERVRIAVDPVRV